MLLTQTNRLKLNRQEQTVLKELCRLSKNLYNVGLYTVRQYYFQERKCLRYESAYHICKTNENYQLLATDIGQQTLKVVDRAFQSFYGLAFAKQQGKFDVKINLPQYLDKEGYFALIIPIRARQKFPDWRFMIPTSREFKRTYGSVYVEIPERLRDKRIKEIRILPKFKARFFDFAYIYEQPDEVINKPQSNQILAIDLGLSNLASCVTTAEQSFIVDGRRLKSLNQWYNKRNACLQSIKDLQGVKGITHQQARLTDRRNQQVRDYLNKAARYIINRCIEQGISKVVVGYNPGIKQEINQGRRNNQNFVQIPIAVLKLKLESLCSRYGIEFVEQEESYTSSASFLDNDSIPIYNADNPTERRFSGKRVKRGLYRTKKGWLINADINGAANILRKHLSKQDESNFGLPRG